MPIRVPVVHFTLFEKLQLHSGRLGAIERPWATYGASARQFIRPKAKAPHQGEECEAFKTAGWGEGEGWPPRLLGDSA
jgi:hypothetical protein